MGSMEEAKVNCGNWPRDLDFDDGVCLEAVGGYCQIVSFYLHSPFVFP